jgi:hypothetical protein
MPDPDLGIDAVAVEALTYASEDVGMSLDMTDTLSLLLGTALAQLDDLSARVAALET